MILPESQRLVPLSCVSHRSPPVPCVSDLLSDVEDPIPCPTLSPAPGAASSLEDSSAIVPILHLTLRLTLLSCVSDEALISCTVLSSTRPMLLG
jgi:hypothetical protein